jgi:hypothetical protein
MRVGQRVRPSVGHYWGLACRLGGKRRDLTLGSYYPYPDYAFPFVTLCRSCERANSRS